MRSENVRLFIVHVKLYHQKKPESVSLLSFYAPDGFPRDFKVKAPVRKIFDGHLFLGAGASPGRGRSGCHSDSVVVILQEKDFCLCLLELFSRKAILQYVGNKYGDNVRVEMDTGLLANIFKSLFL